MAEIRIELGGNVTPEEIIAVREENTGEESVWQNCLTESLGFVTARDQTSNELVGIAFIIGNSRHGELVDLSVHSSVRQLGIGGLLMDELVQFAKKKGIKYLGLTFDPTKPWLKGFYERHGFNTIDFAMWETGSISLLQP